MAAPQKSNQHKVEPSLTFPKNFSQIPCVTFGAIVLMNINAKCKDPIQ